nr:DPY30 domain-containing protein 2-like [Nomia melanderi]
MGFSAKDIDELGELWVLEAKNREEIDSSVSPPSSSDEYLSPDGIYLKNHLSEPLSRAVREIVAKKPSDPIEYLGHWLLNYKVCEERGKRRKELELELAIERRRLESKEKEVKEKFAAVRNRLVVQKRIAM